MVVLTDMLPGGYWDSGGVLHREFELGNMTGREEELLVQASGTETSSLVSAVLSRCVRRLGGISPVTEDVARHLLIADRQYLLLKLRQSTFGDVVRADLFCPWAECGRRISLEFSLADLPAQEETERAPVHTFTLSALASGEDDPVLRAVSFRLPNGSDQEAVSGLLAENEAEALSRLLARAIQAIGPRSPANTDEVGAALLEVVHHVQLRRQRRSKVWQREEVEHRLAHRIDPRQRYDVARERRVVVIRIEHADQAAVVVKALGEIARPLQRGRCVLVYLAAGYKLADPFLGHEEEEPLLVRVPMLRNIHGTAKAISLDVVPVRHSRSSGAVLDGVVIDPGVGVEFLMTVVPGGRAVKVLGSVLGHHGDGSARVASEFGGIVRSRSEERRVGEARRSRG